MVHWKVKTLIFAEIVESTREAGFREAQEGQEEKQRSQRRESRSGEVWLARPVEPYLLHALLSGIAARELWLGRGQTQQRIGGRKWTGREKAKDAADPLACAEVGGRRCPYLYVIQMKYGARIPCFVLPSAGPSMDPAFRCSARRVRSCTARCERRRP